MTFLHPWVLLLLLPLGAWTFFEWRRTWRPAALLAKAILAALIVVALAQPRLTIFEQRVAVALLADHSASIPAEDRRRLDSDLVARLNAARGRHTLRVIPFDPDARQTNLEAALRNALGALPPDRVPRILLASDGQETTGSVERAIYQARQLGTPVDTYPLEGTPRPDLEIESVALPTQALAGERFYIEVAVRSPRAATASIELTAEGKPIGRAEVRLAAGSNSLRVRAQIDAVGATPVAGLVRSPDLGQVRFDRVVVLRRPRALLVTREPPQFTRHLRQVLDAARFEITESPGALPRSLRPYHLVLANNYDVETWPADAKKQIEDYVREGGGFALIAGENNVYVERPQPDDDPLARMLPARLAPPRTPEGTAVVLIVDKSSSMEGKKMELARLAAIGVVSNLRPIDLVGVLIFDNSFQWAVPIRKADNPAVLKRLIAGITPDGGTQIAPALSEAFRQVRRLKAVYRHVVLLTDGISEEGDSMATAREAANSQVTISTVGLGQDVNRAYLEKVAALAKGKAYFLLELANLEQLLLRDVMEHTGSSAVEKPVQPAVTRDAEILEDVGMAKAPPLLGYLKFVAKPRAELLLEVDGRDPLLTRWQYGLGRSAVFASDAKPRWAANWIGWPGYDRFWTNLLRDLLPRSPETEARAVLDHANNQVVATYRLSPGAEIPSPLPEIYALGTDFRKAVKLERVAPLVYQARVPIQDRQGLFRLRPAEESSVFPEIGLYREEAELTRYGSSPELLRQIAESTGGRFQPSPAQAFDAGGRSVSTTMDLWPALLALAILINLAELAARKGYWLRRLLRSR